MKSCSPVTEISSVFPGNPRGQQPDFPFQEKTIFSKAVNSTTYIPDQKSQSFASSYINYKNVFCFRFILQKSKTQFEWLCATKFPALSEDKTGRIEKELSEREIVKLAFFRGNDPQISSGGGQIHQSIDQTERRHSNQGGEQEGGIGSMNCSSNAH